MKALTEQTSLTDRRTPREIIWTFVSPSADRRLTKGPLQIVIFESPLNPRRNSKGVLQKMFENTFTDGTSFKGYKKYEFPINSPSYRRPDKVFNNF